MTAVVRRKPLFRLAPLEGRLRILDADLTRDGAFAEAFRIAEPEIVHHLATPRGDGADAPARLVGGSVAMALALAAELRRSPRAKAVVAGSSLEFGECDGPIRDDAPLEPTTWHGAGKAAASLVHRTAVRSGARITLLRLFHVYGPGESPHRLVPTAIRAATSGEAVRLPAEDGRRDFVFVEDVVRAHLAAESGDVDGGEFNVGSGRAVAAREVVDIVARLTSRPVAVAPEPFAPRPSDCRLRLADVRRAADRLGFAAEIDLEDGLRRSIEWFAAEPSRLAPAGDAPVIA